MTKAELLFIGAAMLLAAVISTLLLAYWKYEEVDRRQRKRFIYALVSVVCSASALVTFLTVQSIRNPPEFDFLLFWSNGKIAAQGLNYYSAQSAAELFQLSHASEEFKLELSHNPFLYPPPTILFFLPLGWFSYKMAALVWYVFQIACLVMSIPVLSRVFLDDRSLKGRLLTAGLVLVMYGAYSNIKTGQTLFLLLALVALAFRDRDAFAGGIWLGLCSLLKPFAAILLLYAVLRRKWKAVWTAFVTLAVSSLGTFILFGPSVFKSYFGGTNYGALPRSMYLEPQNQSLLAWMLRLAGDSRASVAAFIVLAIVLVGVTVWRSLHRSVEGDQIAFALALTLALLIYPGSLRSYSILLIVPILLLVRRKRLGPIALAYGLMVLAGGRYIALASGLLWLIFAAAARRSPQTMLGPVSELSDRELQVSGC